MKTLLIAIVVMVIGKIICIVIKNNSNKKLDNFVNNFTGKENKK